ncbi:MAG: hypothetical protein E3J72_01545 [Planctomycetota bacterium]|nr:MAG: hypothetical protein E3J72_01545 [Planctomycetota bacterium]
MRCITAILVSILAVSTAYAEEVVLEPETTGDNVAPFVIQHALNREIGWKKTEAPPEGTKAPDGEKMWGKLKLGRLSYDFFISMDNGNFVKLYVDRDGDKDFLEETALDKAHGYCFIMENLPAKFEVGGKEILLNMRVVILPEKPLFILVHTAFGGKLENIKEPVKIYWLPGEKAPKLFYGGFEFRGELAIGNKLVEIGEKAVRINKKNQPAVAYNLRKLENLFSVEAPEDLVCLTTFTEDRKIRMYFPVEGKIYQKDGKFSNVHFVIRRLTENERYSLNIGTGKTKVGNGFSIGPIEPLKISVDIEKKEDGKVGFKLNIKDASSRKAVLLERKKGLLRVGMVVKDSSGKVIVSHEFVNS